MEDLIMQLGIKERGERVFPSYLLISFFIVLFSSPRSDDLTI